jgi:serine phosphatase RsbU (regulator of sigma subunit)
VPPPPPHTPAHTRLATGDLVRVLLVEDDPGDAFLVEELLREDAAPVDMRRAQSLTEGLDLLRSEPFDCVLLDLGLPDASGLAALERLREAAPFVAHLVLTGDRDDQRGIEAVAAGAQDYLVKGSVDGDGLRRAILYAVERRQADSVRERLRAAEILAEEATRLERGLLPVPILNDGALLVGTGYRPGRERTLLGDFYDLVHTRDGAVHLMIGDVSGHGADEAALGVCLRVAWRTLTLGGMDVDRVLPTLQDVLVHERHADEIFATVSTIAITPDRATATVRGAGHPPPVLLGAGDGSVPTLGPGATGPPLGVLDDARWPARELALPPRWGLLLLTDGLIEGRAASGASARLGMDGLIALLATIEAGASWAEEPSTLVADLIDAVLELNGGALLDDIAALLLTGGRSGG